jgi:hypothetical protein
VLQPTAAPPLAPTHLPAVGRTAWDFLAESRWVLLVLVPVLVLIFIVVVFAVFMYARARREGRSFALIPPRIGARDEPAPASQDDPPEAEVIDLETPLRAALEIARHGNAIALAKDDAAAALHEGALLNTVVTFTTPGHEGVRRRASVLEAVENGAGERVLRVRTGSPPELFKTPRREFLLAEYKRFAKGLCWAAVDGCLRALSANAHSLDQYVLRVDSVRDESSYLEIPGHHPFASILIAPMLFEDARGGIQVQGVVCLDSSETEHYSAVDGYLLALAAAELGAAWRTRSRKSVAW